jgi:hypothetical protein
MENRDVKSLKHRRDDRSIKDFKDDISKYTEHERIAAELIQKDLQSKGHEVDIKDYGMDNDGSLIIKSRKVNAKPDYLFIIDGKNILFEIKVHSEQFKCMTFKKSNLLRYKKEKSNILIIRENGYYIITTKTIDHICKNFDFRIYKSFSPNDISVRLNNSEIKTLVNYGMIQYRKWNDDVQKIVKTQIHIFKRKNKDD